MLVISIDEKINKRYVVISTMGKGAFGSVIKAYDNNLGINVAIKIMRKNMNPSGIKEHDFLKKLGYESEEYMHVVRLIDSFYYKSHFCLVMELLKTNLRDALKIYGKGRGIRLSAIKIYAQQLFKALFLLKKCTIIHADVKPDNILISENKLFVKLCDFGTALDSYVKPNVLTPYLVSRYYRAPEIIIGAPYNTAIDIWSLGCTLYEMYTGKILFPGESNNEMIKLMMECKGKIPIKIINQGIESSLYFDEKDNFSFIYRYKDAINNNDLIKKLHIKGPLNDIKSLLKSTSKEYGEDLFAEFSDLLEKCLMLNPEKRITPIEALGHPFFSN